MEVIRLEDIVQNSFKSLPSRMIALIIALSVIILLRTVQKSF